MIITKRPNFHFTHHRHRSVRRKASNASVPLSVRCYVPVSSNCSSVSVAGTFASCVGYCYDLVCFAIVQSGSALWQLGERRMKSMANEEIVSKMTTSNGELLGLAFMAFFIITLSSTARYYFKFFCFIAFSVVCAVGPVPLMLIRPRDYRNALIPAYLCIGFGKMLGASFTVRGKENIQRKHGGVVLMNHQSALDLIVLAELWPIMGRSTVVAKKEVLYMFPFGLACWLWGTLFIDRQNRDSAKSVINKEAKAINEKQAKLLFFPEGTRGNGDKLLPFKKGSFHVAVESQAFIQPVVISKYHFLKSNAKIFNRGQNIIKILPEVPCAGLTKDDIPELMERVQKMMQREYELLSEESLSINNISEVVH